MKIKITDYHGFVPGDTNLTFGSTHNVVDPPEEYVTRFPNSSDTVWVSGIGGQPIRLVAGEFEMVKVHQSVVGIS